MLDISFKLKNYFGLNRKTQKKPELILLENKLMILPGTDISNCVTEELIMLIHPFLPKCYVSNKKNPNYEQRITELVRNYKSPILIGFDYTLLSASTSWLQNFNPEGPRIIYQTHFASSSPNQLTEEDLIENIRYTFNPSKIKLCGAELWLEDNGNLSKPGCVNYMYRLLNPHFTVNLDKEYCWKN
ncbi:MAG: hypothetical protein ACP5N1_04750 [Candidatus Woesearchaeota archaeon]